MSPAHNRSRLFILLASLLGGLGVGLGAFGAHGLKHLVEPRLLEVFNTAVQYQLLHALALLALAVWMRQEPILRNTLNRAAWAWVVGILLFSGSLYAYILSYTLAGVRFFAFITPLGGVFFILGWLLLFWAAWKLPKH
ncbi:MAG: hypothetical protein B7Y40_07145 [Gammaproteobacteria bacterium 28-57-27]|nr:MAG: hypothetical protein B7Y40_07145 [Gammaproteobacteria bacterium 28-57-27]